jgi:hypothetical protein
MTRTHYEEKVVVRVDVYFVDHPESPFTQEIFLFVAYDR